MSGELRHGPSGPPADIVPLTDGDKGDITVSAFGSLFTIDPAVVTPAKMAPIAANTLLANPSAVPASPIEHPFTTLAGAGLSYSAGVLSVALGSVTAPADSFPANPTAAPASLVFHPFATLAGDGLSYSAGVLHINSSTSVIITSDQPQRAALTGDVTAPLNTNATTIANGAVTVAKMAQGAADSFLANPTAAPATLVNHPFATLAGAGLAYAAGALAVTGSTSITIVTDQVQRAALTGDVTAAVNVNATVIANDAVTNVKAANMAANSIKSNPTAASADPQDQALAVQSLLLRGAANIVNAACGADESLQRVGAAELGFSATPRLLRAPQVLTSGTTINHPTGTRLIVVEGVGGGGASGGTEAVAGSISGAGASGTWGKRTFTANGASSSYAIGAAGTGVSAATGGAGGSSTFTHDATTLTLPGGPGGTFLAGGATVAVAPGGATSTAATNADISIAGMPGQDGARTAAATTPNFSGAGGSNPLGSGAASRWCTASELAGLGPSGFGAGGPARVNGTSAAARAGNSGAPGVFIVSEYS